MTRYYIRIDDLTNARGADSQFAWSGQSPQDLAQTLQQTLSDPAFANRWRDAQPEPEEVDAGLLATDAGANVSIEQKAQNAGLIVSTALPHRLLAHRLNLLIGAHWKLGDVQ